MSLTLPVYGNNFGIANSIGIANVPAEKRARASALAVDGDFDDLILEIVGAMKCYLKCWTDSYVFCEPMCKNMNR